MVLPSGHVPDIVGTKLKISGTLSANNIMLGHYCGHVPDVPSQTVCVPVKLAGQCPCTTLLQTIIKHINHSSFKPEWFICFIIVWSTPLTTLSKTHDFSSIATIPVKSVGV